MIGLLIGRAENTGGELAAQPGPVDVGFSQDMAVHHLQAVDMGNLARDRGADDKIRNLGFDIAATQQGQVGRMQGWLTLWNKPEQALGELMSWLPPEHDHGGSAPAEPGDAAMPGMATSAEMAKLASLSGEKFDVYFLQLMLRHHEGGAPMAEYAAEHAKVPAVRSLARSMVTSQGAEMELMRNMLAARGAKPLPF
ncbi:MAG: DUF305 domain-containing protein [Actinophytocola sp.]|nr:DUF305 domain-containing protein [Actinophytocola sp.]